MVLAFCAPLAGNAMTTASNAAMLPPTAEQMAAFEQSTAQTTTRKASFWQRTKSSFKQMRTLRQLKKEFNKSSGMSDPTQKWLYLAGIFAIASLVAGFFFANLSGLLWAAAGVCLLIWLLKYINII
jgi:Flp pilus assembly protein TadB